MLKDYSKFTVMVVDDEPAHRKYLKHLIKKDFNANVIEASHPKEAFEMMKEGIPDLIMLDMQMPVMDGYTALKYIRSLPATAEVPVIGCSSVTDKELIIRLAKLKINDYVSKSSDSTVIVEKLKAIFAKIEKKKGT